MSTLKELLKDVPVEWKTAEEIFNIKNGYTPSKHISEYWSNGSIPWLRMEDIRKNGRVLNKTIQHVSESAIKNNLIPANSLIMSTTATLGEHALVLIPFITNQQITSFSLKNYVLDSISIKYLFYHFFDFGIWCQENANKNGGLGIIGLDKLKKYKFPIPHPNDPQKSLAIQQEIVRVLDSLSEQNKALTTALTNEIDNRKKQYEYYREELFRFEGKEVEWRTFGDLGEIIRGNGLQKSDFTESGVGCIHYGQIYTYYGTSTVKTKSFVSPELALKLKKVSKGDLIITNTSENVEDVCKAVAWLGEDEIVTGGHACILKHKQNPKYIAYYTQISEFYKDKRKFAKGTKVMDVSAKDLAKIKIPILPIQEQERIVRLLDQYDVTTKNIIAELEKEIELRNKQFEYYRNLLLTLEKLKEVTEVY